jgi:hypothetical protein
VARAAVCVGLRPFDGRRTAADFAPRRPESAVSFRLWAATSLKAVALQFPREHAISTAVFFHFSVVGAKRGGGPAGRGACRSERAGWPARQAADLRPHRTSREPFPFTRSSTSAVPAPTAAVDDRRAINRFSNARPPAPHVKAPPPPARSLRTLGVACRPRISHL